MGLVGDRGEHLIRVSELSGYLQDFRVMEERAVKHALLVDNKPIADVKPGVQDGAIHVAKVWVFAIGTQTRPGHLTDKFPVHGVLDAVLN